jgi:hypothetical protein
MDTTTSDLCGKYYNASLTGWDNPTSNPKTGTEFMKDYYYSIKIDDSNWQDAYDLQNNQEYEVYNYLKEPNDNEAPRPNLSCTSGGFCINSDQECTGGEKCDFDKLYVSLK